MSLPLPSPTFDGTVPVTLLGLLGSLATLRCNICFLIVFLCPAFRGSPLQGPRSHPFPEPLGPAHAHAKAPGVLWPPDSPPEGSVPTEAAALGRPPGGGERRLTVSSRQDQTAVRPGTKV